MQQDDSDQADDFVSASCSVLEDLHARVGMDAWYVSRRDGEDQVILCAIDDTFGITTGSVFPWSDSYCAQMIDAQAPMVACDIDEVPAYVQARARNGFAAGACLTVPILAPDGEKLGTLCSLGKHEYSQLGDFLPTVRLQAKLLGTLLSHELHRAQESRRIEQAESNAHSDPLTGLRDHRGWEAALRTEEVRAGRYATSVAVVVIKLDALSNINQISGHQAGDELLLQSATLLAKRLRAVDVLARVGGADFGIILPGTTPDGAQAVAQNLRDLLAQARISASIGIGQRRSDTGMTGAWRTADAAMTVDKLQAAQRFIRDHDVPPAAEAADVPSVRGPSEAGLSSIDALLHLAKNQLCMDVAFLSKFDGENRQVRNLVSSVELPVKAGFTQPRQGTFCQLIVDKVLDEVIPDVASDPRASELVPQAQAMGIGAYIGIPILRRNGTLYGTLCAFSRQPDDTLRERDTGVLHAIAGVVMDLVDVEENSHHHRHEVLQRLETLYASHGPDIVYQPIKTLDRLETIGVEALSRFPRGSANPDQWFTTASEAGVGTKLELAAMHNAVAVLPHLNGFLALNVSPATVCSPGFSRFMTEVPLHRIVLEVTEHEAIEDYQTLLSVLKALRQAGLRVAIDDAGAGFASMRHILKLVPDFIKLDISLVRGIDTDLPRQALAAALATFAFKTGAMVIAEGIETEQELDCLRTLHIDCGQGYHLARPAPIASPASPHQTTTL